MTAFWCERAVVGDAVLPSVRIEEKDGVISAVAAYTEPRDTDTPLAGLVLPGLANGHSHAFHRALRGRTHADGGTFWTWREKMYRVANALDPDNYYELATAVFAEMVLAGYTVVGEFHYVHHRPDGRPYENATAMEDAVVAAAARAGIRLTLLDTLYLQGGLDGTGRIVPLSNEQFRFTDGTVERWSDRREAARFGPLARAGAAIHSVRAVPPSLFGQIREATRGIPLHAHVSEQPAENVAVQAAFGATPTALFAEADLLGESFTAVHGTHLSDADIRLLGASRSTVCFCPTTERDLADGIGPATALRDAGARISLGSDQNAVIDPFEELRGLEMDDRLASGERGRFTPAQLLTAATSDGYASLGWDGGRIEVGAVCDLVAIAMATPRTAGAAPAQAWLAASSADVKTVIVGGVIQVDAGRHTLGDIGELLDTAIGTVST
jgi:formiminoglutamate deiminase